MASGIDDDDDDETRSHICVDCRVMSPTTHTNYTLIGSRYGWRLTLGVDANGVRTVEWRCPACWARWRQKQR